MTSRCLCSSSALARPNIGIRRAGSGSRPRTFCSHVNANALPWPVTEDALRTTAPALARTRSVGRRLPSVLEQRAALRSLPQRARCSPRSQALRPPEIWPSARRRQSGEAKPGSNGCLKHASTFPFHAAEDRDLDPNAERLLVRRAKHSAISTKYGEIKLTKSVGVVG